MSTLVQSPFTYPASENCWIIANVMMYRVHFMDDRKKEKEVYPQMYVGFKKDKTITIRFTNAENLSIADITRMYKEALKEIQVVYFKSRQKAKEMISIAS